MWGVQVEGRGSSLVLDQVFGDACPCKGFIVFATTTAGTVRPLRLGDFSFQVHVEGSTLAL